MIIQNNPNLNMTSYQRRLSDNSSAPAFGTINYSGETSNKKNSKNNFMYRILGDTVGMLGVNAVLWGMQDFVNSKLLIGKINKYFTKGIENKNSLLPLAADMIQKHKLANKLKVFGGNLGEAYYTHAGNYVVVGQDKYSALFHEIGHAVIENKTTVLKALQRFRGNYTVLSLALYTLLSQTPDKKDIYGEKNQGTISKAKRFLDKNDYIIPLVAFSPELLTEGAATRYGIKFLKEAQKAGKIEKSIVNKIKMSYLTCFSTYLFIPVSIILLDWIRKKAANQ